MRLLLILATTVSLLTFGVSALVAQDLRVDGSSPAAFERSMAAIAATIPQEDKDAFDKGFNAIFADRYMKLENGGAEAGIAAMDGVTREEILAAGKGVVSGTVASAESLTEAGWHYSSHTDDMTGDTIRSAYITSSDTFEFSAPYSGEQYAILSIRHHPRNDTDVMLRIERGQFACGIADCEIKVRFDDGPIQTVQVTSPTDMDSTVKFIRKPMPFLHALKKAQTVRIEAVFYNEGSRVFAFKTAGLRDE